MSKPEELTVDDYHDVVRLFHGEPDRSAAVLAGSFAEHYAGIYLRSFMVDDPKLDELFTGFGPFASFSQRISACYAFGFIDSQLKNDLNTIKAIRNHFAHHPKEVSFETDKLRTLCSNLSTSKPFKNDEGEDFTVKEPKLWYLFAISLFVARAHNTMLAKSKKKP